MIGVTEDFPGRVLSRGDAPASLRCSGFACGLPRLGVLPACVGGVIEVEQEAFAAV